MDRDALADFLHRRRERLQPDGMGLPATRRRRTASMRREEVAALAHMSTDLLRAPRAVARLAAVGRDGRRACLCTSPELGRARPPAPARRPCPGAAPRANRRRLARAVRVLGRLDTPARSSTTSAPCCVRTLWPRRSSAVRLPTRACGAASSTDGSPIWTNATGGTRRPRPALPQLRRALRAAHGRGHDDEASASSKPSWWRATSSPALWQRHEVGDRTDTRKRLVHPLVEPLTLDCQILTSESGLKRLVIVTAVPGSQDADRAPAARGARGARDALLRKLTPIGRHAVRPR